MNILLFFFTLFIIAMCTYGIYYILRKIAITSRGKEKLRIFLNYHPQLKKKLRAKFNTGKNIESYSLMWEVVDELRTLADKELIGTDREGIAELLERNTKEGTLNCVQDFLN